jgi:hypothetical protein
VSESQQISSVELTFSGEDKAPALVVVLSMFFFSIPPSTNSPCPRMTVSQGLPMLLMAERDVLALTG